MKAVLSLLILGACAGLARLVYKKRWVNKGFIQPVDWM
jgi:hypothetical protein